MVPGGRVRPRRGYCSRGVGLFGPRRKHGSLVPALDPPMALDRGYGPRVGYGPGEYGNTSLP